MEDGDDLECGIGMSTEDNGNDKVGKTNTLSELFGVENKRVPEDDNFDLGLGLESPDMTKTNGYFTLVNLVQGVHIKQSLSRAPRPTERKLLCDVIDRKCFHHILTAL